MAGSTLASTDHWLIQIPESYPHRPGVGRCFFLQIHKKHMTQQQLESQVAAITGESIQEIQNRGFSEVSLPNHSHDDFDEQLQRAPFVVDWDVLDRERSVAVCYPSRLCR